MDLSVPGSGAWSGSAALPRLSSKPSSVPLTGIAQDHVSRREVTLPVLAATLEDAPAKGHEHAPSLPVLGSTLQRSESP